MRAVADPGADVMRRCAPPSPARRRLLGRLTLLAGGMALWPSAALGAPNARSEAGAAELSGPFGMPPRRLDSDRLLREVSAVVASQARELGAPAEYGRKVGPVAARVDFQEPFPFLVTTYFEREPERRDALLALYARDQRRAIRDLGPAFPSPRAEMILGTFAYYDVGADRIRVNLGRIPEAEAARVLVHEFWHALPDLRTWREASGTAYRATGFWAQRKTSGVAVWEPVDDAVGLPYSAYLLNEAMATRMEVRYAGPSRFARPDLDAADGFLTRLTDAAGSEALMHAYLGSQPDELRALAGRHGGAVPELASAARR